MKKILLSSLVALGLSTSVNADFIGASVGAGVWNQKIDGYIQTGDDKNYFNNSNNEAGTGNLGLNANMKPFIWAKIIHPVPLIPNLKVEYREYDLSGDGTATTNFKIFGESVSVSGNVHTDIEIKSYDATFFYEIKPVVVDLEAGFGVNLLQGKATVSDSTLSSSANFVAPLPYLYARAETMKFYGFALEAQAKYIEVKNNYYKDFDAGLKYFAPIPVLDVSAKIGYKMQDIKGVSGDNSTKIEFEGAYAEIAVKW
jgi:outer membrane protein